MKKLSYNIESSGSEQYDMNYDFDKNFHKNIYLRNTSYVIKLKK